MSVTIHLGIEVLDTNQLIRPVKILDISADALTILRENSSHPEAICTIVAMKRRIPQVKIRSLEKQPFL